MNDREWISKADLDYAGIDRLPEEGLPVGNGRMGTLLWLDASAIHMLLNRVDVFSSDESSTAFGPMDAGYSAGCGFVDVQLSDLLTPVFGPETKQHLSVADGKATMIGAGVQVECFPCMDQDGLVLHITDMRQAPQPVRVSLRTLRYESQYVIGMRPQTHPSLVQEGVVSYAHTRGHLATSLLTRGKDRVGLRQRFEEGDFFCQSNLEIAASTPGCAIQNRNPTETVLELPAMNREVYLYIATAQSFDREGSCETPLDALLGQGGAALAAASLQWWKAFWNRAPVIRLHSADGYADNISASIVYFIYIMATVSRGRYMPRYGGLLFMTDGDYRTWGSQFWWHNQSCYYSALFNLGLLELTDPMIRQIDGMAENEQLAARQQWGSQGRWHPETTAFNGPAPLPENIATEMQALYTHQKPWKDHTEAFWAFADGHNTFDARWNWTDYKNGRLRQRDDRAPHAYVTHIFSSTAKVAWWFWKRYQLTYDLDFLRDHAYPLLRDTAEFYRCLPLIKRGDDGRLHLTHTSNHEGLWDCTDSFSELCAIHGILPIAIRAAQTLQTDAELQRLWAEFLQNIADIPTTDESDAVCPPAEGIWENNLRTGNDGQRAHFAETVWACARQPAPSNVGDYYNQTDAYIRYDLITPETPAGTFKTLADQTYRAMLQFRQTSLGVDEEGYPVVGTLDNMTDAIGRHADPENFRLYCIGQNRNNTPIAQDFCDFSGAAHKPVLANRLFLREGPQAMDAQRLGHLSASVASAVCSAFPPAPGEDPVVYLFSSTPAQWEGNIRMQTAKGYTVEAAWRNGQIDQPVRFTGGALPLRVLNPWPGSTVTVDNGSETTEQSGRVLQIKGPCTLRRKADPSGKA